jgi:hypothetical protein
VFFFANRKFSTVTRTSDVFCQNKSSQKTFGTLNLNITRIFLKWLSINLIKTEILLWLRMRVAYQSTALFDIVKMGNIYNTFASEYIWHIWSHHFECFMVTTMTWLTLMKYLFHKWPRICSTCRKHLPVLSSFMIIIGFVTRLTQRVPLMQQ